MELSLLVTATYKFLKVLEYLILFYYILSWISKATSLRKMMHELLEPIFRPVRAMLRHSVFNTAHIDMAPIITFFAIIVLQEFVLQINL